MAYLAAGLLVLSLPLSILSNNAIRTLFSPDDISEPLVNLLILRGGVRDQIADTLIAELWQEGAVLGDVEAPKYLSAQDRLQITQILFPAGWIREQLNQNLDILVGWIEAGEALPELFIDLSPIKENLQEGGSRGLAEIIVESWPICGNQQERQLDSALQKDSSVRFVYCRSQGDLYQRTINHVEQQIIQFKENIPDSIPLWDQINREDGLRALEEFRQSVLGLLRILNFIKPAPFLFLGIIMTLIIRSWRDLGRWWGIPLGMGAIFTLLLILLGHGFGPGILKNAMSQSGQVPDIQEPIVDAVWEVFAKILNRSVIQAFVYGAIGLVLFILSQKSKKIPSELPQVAVSEEKSVEAVEEIPPPPQVEPFDPDSLASTSKRDPS
jgi:hypothetical protein